MSCPSLRFVLLVVPLVFGCAVGHGKLPIPGDQGAAGSGAGGTTSGVLSEFDLEIVKAELGVLPETPPPDPSNDYADDVAAAALGEEFFFDPRYSGNGQVSCATCHDPNHGFQDDRASSVGVNGYTGRHAPSVLNSAYGSGLAGATVWQFWDGRVDSQWSQALHPPENDTEMQSTRIKVALLIYDKYKTAYEAVFPALPALRDTSGNAVVAETIKAGSTEWNDDSIVSPALRQGITAAYVNFGKAIAAYERKLVSRDSKFDAFMKDISAGAADSAALSDSEKLGLKTFVTKGKCTSCHRGANFTDWKFHNIGVPQVGDHVLDPDNGRSAAIATVVADEFRCTSSWSDQADTSRCAVGTLGTQPSNDADVGAFKTPSLRSVTTAGPYFHTGAVVTLADVIAFYDGGGSDSGYVGTRSGDIVDLNLNDAERQALVDFLGALQGAPLDASLTTPPALP